MANNKDTAVVKTGEEAEAATIESALPAIVDENIVDIAAHAEERLAALDKIKMVALKLTNPHDWVDEGGKPYLQGSGAEKVARLFGISWRIFEPTEEDIGQGHYIITYKGEFALGGAIITAIGARSSKDGFFKKYRYEGEGNERKKIELPPSEIDKGDVKKAAYTNLLANGITRLLGIRNLTYEDLNKYAGIRQDQVSTVEYKKGGKSQSSQGRAPSSSQEKKQPTNGDEQATQAQAQAIHSILDNKGVKDELSKMQTVQSILGLKETPTSVGKLTKSQASTVIAALQREQEGGEDDS